MRRPLWFRALVAVWGLWFTAALVEAPGIHACAVHSGAVSHNHSTSSSAAATHMASHAQHHAAPADTQKRHAATCSCLGACCGVSPFVAAGRVADLEPPATISTESRIVALDAAPVIDRPHAQPFANGPPVD